MGSVNQVKPPAFRDYQEQARARMNESAPRLNKLEANRTYLQSKGKWSTQDEDEFKAIEEAFLDLYNRVVQGPFPINRAEYENIVDDFDQIDEQIQQINNRHQGRHEVAPSGFLLPNGTRIGGGVHTGPGAIGGIGGAPSLPGNMGGLLGSLGGNRSGRGPGGSQFMPGLGFFPGAGPGPGGVGHGIGGIGLGGDEPPGPGIGGGSFKKHSGSGTGRQPGNDGGNGGSRRGSGPGYSEKGTNDGGGHAHREKYGSGDDRGTGGSGDTHSDERAGKDDGVGPHVDPNSGSPDPKTGTDVHCASLNTVGNSNTAIDALNVDDPCNPNKSGDPEGEGGGSEGPPIHKGGPYFTPHGGSTGGVGVIVAGGLGPRVPGSPVSYLDFLYKNVGPDESGWGGNNPVVTPAIKPSDLFKPADDSIGPYNPKGTDYRPAPDDPTPGGPAGAAGRATRVRVG